MYYCINEITSLRKVRNIENIRYSSEYYKKEVYALKRH